jgi:hypothetical protein
MGARMRKNEFIAVVIGAILLIIGVYSAATAASCSPSAEVTAAAGSSSGCD